MLRPPDGLCRCVFFSPLAILDQPKPQVRVSPSACASAHPTWGSPGRRSQGASKGRTLLLVVFLLLPSFLSLLFSLMSQLPWKSHLLPRPLLFPFAIAFAAEQPSLCFALARVSSPLDLARGGFQQTPKILLLLLLPQGSAPFGCCGGSYVVGRIRTSPLESTCESDM